MPLRKSDVFRNEIVTRPELVSDGYGLNSVYLFSNLISTVSSSKTVTVSFPPDDVSLVYSDDYQVNPGDIVAITGSNPGGIANGKYTVNNILTDTTFTVNEFINDSTDGYISFMYPSGATLVGFDNSTSCVITHNTVQGALSDLDAAVCGSGGSGITPTVHAELRQLIHLADGVGGPFEGFATGAYRVTSPSGALFPTNITWYASNLMLAKIVEKITSYTSFNQPSTVQWLVYDSDGVTILAMVTDTISYSGMFEINRTRSITNTPIGGALTVETHKTVRQLIHLADGIGGPFEAFPTGAYRVTSGGVFPTSIIWYSDSSMVSKIVEKSISYNTISEPDSITWKVYDTDGVTVLATATDNISYTSNIFETSRTRNII